MSGPCPSCRGNPREEVDGEVYVCPDCAGTGKAENSITANEKLRDAAPRLAAALKRCADALDSFACDPPGFPAVEWTEEDAEAVREAFAALREAGIES